MFSCGWIWMYAGAALMMLELLSPGFVMFFFGLSAASVGLIRLWLGDGFPPMWQAIAFSAFSIFHLLVLRRWLKGVFSGDVEKTSFDGDGDFAGRAGRVTAAIRPPAEGRVLVGDAEWNASAPCEIPEGADVVVTGRGNLTLRVKPAAAV